VIAIGAAVLITLGGVLAGLRETVDLFNGPSQPPPKPVHFSAAELTTVGNDRFGFSFDYPASWERRDSLDGDGTTGIGPEPGFELTAAGSYAVVGPKQLLDRLDYLMDLDMQVAKHGEQIGEPHQQNVTVELPEGEMTQLIGTRYVVREQTSDDGETVDVTSTVLAATTGDCDITIRCRVPTPLYPRYEGACNQLVATLTLKS
jgi:hypothetical protein